MLDLVTADADIQGKSRMYGSGIVSSTDHQHILHMIPARTHLVAIAAAEDAAQPRQQRGSCGKHALTVWDVSDGVRQRVGTDRFSG